MVLWPHLHQTHQQSASAFQRKHAEQLPFVGLIGGDIIFAIINTIADLSHWDASVIQAGELAVRAWWIVAVLLVRSIFAVVFVVAFPGFEDTAAVVAAELVRRAGMES